MIYFGFKYIKSQIKKGRIHERNLEKNNNEQLGQVDLKYCENMSGVI